MFITILKVVRREEYKRLYFVNKHIKEIQKNYDEMCIYVDLATGSTMKHMFDIRFYGEEQNLDMQVDEEFCQKLSAIPVVLKYNETNHPIQDYSFALRSISDRKISILRIYAEDKVALEIQNECQRLYSEGFTSHMNEMAKMQRELDETIEKEAMLQAKLDKMRADIS